MMDNIKIFHQSVFDAWPISDNSIQAIITSPPYWGLRKYNIPDVVIGGEKDCEHEFIEHFKPPNGGKNHPDRPSIVGANRNMSEMDIRGVGVKSGFCIKCDAWKGQYGLEPSYKYYIEHTKLWCKEVFRVLKDDGIFFLNIGDSYQTQSGVNAGKNPEKYANLSMNAITNHIKQQDLPNKCRMLIPERIAIALIDEGFTLRNHIIWHKPNGMPESTKDRFSKKWESIFMFVKNEKYYFDLDSVKITPLESSLKRYKTPYYKQDNITDKKVSRLNVKTQNRDLWSKGKNPGDMWSIATQPSSEKHYAMWPEKLVERMILCSTKVNDIILDPFCGSGTTLKVAIKNNRIGYGIDLGYSDIQERKLKDIQKNII